MRLLVLLLVVLSPLTLFAEEPVAERPNFLVILCDDLGYGDLACYGHPQIKTPQLDKLAEQGVRLTDCYSSAPVCSPSRAGMLTGRTPTRVGVFDWIPGGNKIHLSNKEVTVATLLRDAGYDTSHTGKWHLNGKFNSSEQPQPGDHGFNHWFSTQNNASPSHKGPRNFVRNGERVGPLEGFSCQEVADETVRWLEHDRDKKRPFFAFVCFHEPHEPIDSPQEFVEQYPTAKKKGEALYYANVQNLDRAVGTLMEALDKLELADDTLVFFTSDNGPETLNRYGSAWRSHGSPGPLRGMKLHVYDGGIRVPGILRWPARIKPGQTSGEPISGVDLLPTLCELADAKLPADRQLDGASFVTLLEGKPVEREQPLFWHYYRAFPPAKVAIRMGDWKMCGHLSGEDYKPGAAVRTGDISAIKSARISGVELYNVREDIAEQHDLAKAEPERRKAMQKQLEEIFASVVDEAPSWSEPVKPE